MEYKNFRLIDAGKFAIQCGDPGLGEVVLLRSLAHADDFYGPASDISRLIANDLLDFYAERGDFDGFTRVRCRLRFDMTLQVMPE
ncbi:MAG TPA: hypothetical protein V6D22_25530 [Candidatus Obscuribacterales bacterium]